MPRASYLVFVCLLLLAACRRQAERPAVDDGLPTLDALADGWNAITPGGETICSNGTLYAFYARRGDPDKLLIFFQGGGACWYGENCDLNARPTYDPAVDAEDDPARFGGLFDLDRPDNPFAGYSAVFVPYCTADVHLGDKVTIYDVPATDSTEAHQVTIHHKGYVNARAVLTWTFSRFVAPQTVFVTGSSAGAIPSPFYATYVADRYPEAHVVQLGDGAGGYRSPEVGPITIERWGLLDVLSQRRGFASIPADSLTFEALYQTAARLYPAVTFAQYNTAEDEVQRFFLSLVGVTDTPLHGLIEANYADIRRVDPDFRSFTAGGVEHTILGRPEFYTYEAGGVRFRDWVDDLADGRTVETVTCADCTQAAVYASD